MLAYSYPGDDQLRLLHLPTSISVIRVNPAAILDFVSENNGFTQVDSSCSREDRLEPGAGFSGNVSMYYSEALRNAAVQVEHVKFKPVGTTASDDRNVFYKMHFVPSKPDGDLAAEAIPITQDDKDLLWILSRISTYFLRQFDDSVAEDAPARTESPLCHYLHYARHMTNLIRKDEHQWAKKEWLNDTLDDVMNEIEAKGVAGNSDIRIMLLVGHTMPRVFAGETTMLEHFRESGLLDEYYAHGFGTLQSSIWLSNAVKQVTDRHPHLSLLEVGAGTGGATKNILRSIGHDFDQYTFTDISSSFFENAAEALAPWGDRMVFSVFNAEIDPTQQGFKEGAYDVIVAYMVIHATARLDEALRNMRKLLKPGGYLIIGEGASNSPVQAGAGFIFGTLPGWWRGVEEGRVLSPLVSADEWDELLKRTGYAGIDTLSPPRLLDTFGISLFVAQAVDARIDVIRQPLVKQQQPLMKKLIILGGQTTVAGIAEESQKLLSPLADGTSWYKRLEDMPGDLVINHETTILSFLDLETPVFKDMTAERWYRFKGLFTESTVLWLTTGCLADEPYCNMTVGFGRSAVHEEEELRLQFVDVPNPTELSAKYVAESLVRFVTAARQLEGQTDILYTMEPEVIVDDEGRELVPRLKAIGPANDRLNSIQRPITHLVSAKESVIQLHQEGGGYMVRDLSRYELEHSGRDIGADAIELTITHAILSVISTSSGSLFVVLAVDSNGTRHLALVPALISVIVSPKAAAIKCEGLLKSASMTEEALLTLVAAQLVAAAVVKPLRHGQKLLLHNAPRIVVQALAAHCSAKDASLTLTTDRDVVDSADIIKLAPYLGRTELRQLLDLDQVACFVGLSEEGSSETEINILSALPPYCRRESVQTLFSANGPSSVATTIATDLGQDLRTAISNIWGQAVGDANVVSLEALAQGDLATQVPLTVVKNWACSSPVPARITRFDTKPLFKADKTYWSCGLSGALGISLCDWMIEKGVRHLVLTSRNPKIEPAWIENHARRGVVIKILLW
jgi:SAM-dependent methyltransferase